STRAAIRSTCAESVTSHWQASACTPFFSRSATSLSSSDRVRAAIATSAPASASASAIARPMPRLAPVTSALRPARSEPSTANAGNPRTYSAIVRVEARRFHHAQIGAAGSDYIVDMIGGGDVAARECGDTHLVANLIAEIGEEVGSVDRLRLKRRLASEHFEE